MKIKVLSLIGLAIFLLFFGTSCKKKMISQSPPPDIYFQLQKEEKIYPDSILQKVICFYYDKQGNYIDNPGKAFNLQLNDKTFCLGDENIMTQGILHLRYIIEICAEQHINNFYLKLPNGDVDTLWIEAKKTSEGPYWSTMQLLTFNGTAPLLQQSNQPYYIFNKN